MNVLAKSTESLLGSGLCAFQEKNYLNICLQMVHFDTFYQTHITCLSHVNIVVGCVVFYCRGCWGLLCQVVNRLNMHVWNLIRWLLTFTTATTTVLRPFFRDHPGEPVPEENFWTLWCKGRLTEANTPTIWLGATPSGLTSAHHHHPFFTGWMPFLPPNQQCQSTEGT